MATTHRTRSSTTWPFVVAGLLVALALGLVVSPYASGHPDGLDTVAAEAGFDDRAEDHALSDSPVANYAVRGVDGGRLSTGLSGAIGVLLAFAVGLGLFALLRRRRPKGG